MKDILNSLFQTFLNSSAASINSYALGASYSYKYFFSNYEGWNFNSGNYLFTTDTK